MAAGSAGRQRGKIPAQLPVKGKLLEQLLTSGHRPEGRPEPALKGRTDGQDICSHGEIQEDVLVQKAAEGRKKKRRLKRFSPLQFGLMFRNRFAIFTQRPLLWPRVYTRQSQVNHISIPINKLLRMANTEICHFVSFLSI